MEERQNQLVGSQGNHGGGAFQNVKLHVSKALVRDTAELNRPDTARLIVRYRNIGGNRHLLVTDAVTLENDLVVRVTDRNSDMLNWLVSNGFEFQPAAVDHEEHLRTAVDEMERFAGGCFNGASSSGDAKERGVLIQVHGQCQNFLRQIRQFDDALFFDGDAPFLQCLSVQCVERIAESVRISSNEAATYRKRQFSRSIWSEIGCFPFAQLEDIVRWNRQIGLNVRQDETALQEIIRPDDDRKT